MTSPDHTFVTTLTERLPKNYKVLIINKKSTNAYATGILPFSKVILLGRSLLQSFTRPQLEAILGHEMGHLKLNHLMKIYFVNLVWTLTTVTVFQLYVGPFFAGSSFFVLLLGLYYGIFLGAGLLFVSGFAQKKFEKEADAYAAALVGKETVKEVLIMLNEQLQGKMNNWSWNYPTVEERIRHVESLRL